MVETLPDEPAAQVVFDATGNAKSMARALSLARFTGRIVYVGITKDPIILDDPLLHRRELTLLASRNALASDFPRILGLIQQGQINTQPWITHHADWDDLPALMETLTTPGTESVKAIVRIPGS